MASQEEVDSLRKAGDSFVVKVAIALLIVHLLIFPGLSREKRSANEVVGNELQRLNVERSKLEDDLNRVEGDLGAFGKDAMRGGEIRSKKSPARIPWLGEGRVLESDPSLKIAPTKDGLFEARKSILALLEKNAEQFLTLTKAKYDKEVRIPGTDSPIEESQIRTFYPMALALCLLILIFRYRNPLQQAVNPKQEQRLPFWAAPFPYGRYGMSYWKCTAKNLVWLGLVTLTMKLFVLSSLRPEFFASRSQFFANAFAGLVTAVICAGVFVSSMILSRSGAEEQ